MVPIHLWAVTFEMPWSVTSPANPYSSASLLGGVNLVPPCFFPWSLSGSLSVLVPVCMVSRGIIGRRRG